MQIYPVNTYTCISYIFKHDEWECCACGVLIGDQRIVLYLMIVLSTYWKTGDRQVTEPAPLYPLSIRRILKVKDETNLGSQSHSFSAFLPFVAFWVYLSDMSAAWGLKAKCYLVLWRFQVLQVVLLCVVGKCTFKKASYSFITQKSPKDKYLNSPKFTHSC